MHLINLFCTTIVLCVCFLISNVIAMPPGCWPPGERPTFSASTKSLSVLSQLKVIATNLTQSTEDECVICRDTIGDKAGMLTCAHSQFHVQCIEQWIQQQGINASCPICRTKIE